MNILKQILNTVNYDGWKHESKTWKYDSRFDTGTSYTQVKTLAIYTVLLSVDVEIRTRLIMW